MDEEYASYAPDAREILAAFTDGINAFIAHAKGEGTVPLEFALVGFAPEPWKPEDCLSRMAGFPMTGNAVAELYHAELVRELGAAKAARLLDLDPVTELLAAPGLDLSGLAPGLLKDFASSDTRLELQGSNNWAVSGALTKSGKPLLANDPHRTMALPSLRYLVHLVAPGWNVIGAGEPALPGVAAGHNERIAWGFTVFPVDQQDLFVEELDSKDPARYRTGIGWQQVRTEKETIRIKGGLEVEVTLRFTRHGPVVYWDEAGHRALALAWTGSEPGTAGYMGSLALDRALDWRDFLAALDRWKLPAENIVYADTAGNIGGQSAGLVPIRWKSNGLLPVPGTGGFEWAGFLPLADLPRVFNPSSGYYATANDKTIREDFPRPVGFQWAAPFRIQRIREVLDTARDRKDKLEPVDMARLQADVTSLAARQFLRLVAATPLGSDPSAHGLVGWNGFLAQDSEPAALYELWLDEIRAGLVARVAPEALRKDVEARLPLAAVLRLLEAPDPDVFGPSPKEGRDAYLTETLKAARARADVLRAELRPAGALTWGRLHTMKFRHALDEAAPGAAALFDTAPIPRPGDGTTVNATGFGTKGFEQVSGASFREVIDLSDWDRSLAINVPGQSGQPASPHYTDLVGRWADGGLFPLLYSRQGVALNGAKALILAPP
jgi:penicillin G amidase